MLVREGKIYYYICDRCGNKRRTVKDEVMQDGVCPKCQRAARVDKNQMSLLDQVDSGSSDIN